MADVMALPLTRPDPSCDLTCKILNNDDKTEYAGDKVTYKYDSTDTIFEE